MRVRDDVWRWKRSRAATKETHQISSFVQLPLASQIVLSSTKCTISVGKSSFFRIGFLLNLPELLNTEIHWSSQELEKKIHRMKLEMVQHYYGNLSNLLQTY